MATMSLGLSHSLSRFVQLFTNIPESPTKIWSGHRFKLKFSPDKVDTMVVQAIALLDDLDKEINIYSMRVKVCTLPMRLQIHPDTGAIGMVWLALPRDG